MKIKLIGADPEFAAFGTNGLPFSLIPYIKGTKDKKKKIQVEGCFQQIDNVLIEFDIPPQPNYKFLRLLIQNCVSETQNKLTQELGKKVILHSPNYTIYPSYELEDDKAWEIGCSPYSNIYEDKSSVATPYDSNLRTLGYHLHFSFEESHTEEEMKKFILACDAILGLDHLVNDPTALIRMKYYGKPGEYRIKSDKHLEYRTLGGNAFYDEFLYAKVNTLQNLSFSEIEKLWDNFYETNKELYDKNSSIWNS